MIVSNVGFAELAASDNTVKARGSYQFIQETVESGLSANTVYTIEEDKFGFLWFGTENGLNRFDSNEWVKYYFNPTDPEGISNSRILTILSDNYGRLWIGTGKGLNLFSFETNAFTKVFEDDDNNQIAGSYIRCLVQDSDNDIWVGTSSGLSIIRGDSLQVEIENFSLGGGNKGENNIVQIFEDSKGIIWIGTNNGLFYTRNKIDYFRFDEFTSEGKSLKDVQVRSLFEVNDLLLCATENDGLFFFSSQTGQLEQITLYSNDSPRELIYRDLFLDSDSTLWIASTIGLFCVQGQSLSLNENGSSRIYGTQILENSVRNIFEDSNDGIWLATQYNGIYYHYADNFLFNNVGYNPIDFQGLNNPVISSFLVKGDPELIAPGTGSEGFLSLEGYKISEESPCLGSGLSKSEMNVNYWLEEDHLVDFFGNLVYEENMDVGAHQLSGALNMESIENKNEIIFRAYPVPFNEELYLDIKLPESQEILIKLYDLDGREIDTLFVGKIDPVQNKINLKFDQISEQILPGVYLLRLFYSDSETGFTRIIIKK